MNTVALLQQHTTYVSTNNNIRERNKEETLLVVKHFGSNITTGVRARRAFDGQAPIRK